MRGPVDGVRTEIQQFVPSRYRSPIAAERVRRHEDPLVGSLVSARERDVVKGSIRCVVTGNARGRREARSRRADLRGVLGEL